MQSGFLSLIVCFSVAIFIILSLGFCWRRENAARDREQALIAEREGSGSAKDQGARAFADDLTDGQNLSFRYVY